MLMPFVKIIHGIPYILKEIANNIKSQFLAHYIIINIYKLYNNFIKSQFCFLNYRYMIISNIVDLRSSLL